MEITGGRRDETRNLEQFKKAAKEKRDSLVILSGVDQGCVLVQ